MSYAMTAALQTAVFTLLSGDATLDALVGGAIYDALPAGPVAPIHVSLGPERARARSDQTAGGALHDFSVSVVSDQAGFQGAKEAAARISELLDGSAPALSRGRVVSLNFYRARARRTATGREIELIFRARLDDVTVV